MQAAAPSMYLYVPGVQNVQVPPSGPDEPALQVQSVLATLPTGELELVGQLTQLMLPPDEYVPCSHSEHADSASAPAMLEYLPGTQALHDSEPVVAL